jgi:DNA-binding TFAR19-related protein (PDSD5 family)
LTAQVIELLQAGNISKRIDAMLKNLVPILKAIRMREGF